MKKEILYTYLGTNGTITSPVHLEDTYYTRSVRLSADRKKMLTKDGEHFFPSVIVPEDEVSLWREVNEK
jgi:hypothetical protein